MRTENRRAQIAQCMHRGIPHPFGPGGEGNADCTEATRDGRCISSTWESCRSGKGAGTAKEFRKCCARFGIREDKLQRHSWVSGTDAVPIDRSSRRLFLGKGASMLVAVPLPRRSYSKPHLPSTRTPVVFPPGYMHCIHPFLRITYQWPWFGPTWR